MPRYSVVTFGCQMNVHDSERMEHVLLRAGYERALGPDAADVIILNTCSIREKAEQKLRSEVGRLRQLKNERPSLSIVVAGCVAQQEGIKLQKSLPEIDLVLGPDNIPELPGLLVDLELGGTPQVRTVFDLEAPSFLMASPELGPSSATAYVTVMKGCNERCSYCIVPHTRGPERYRPSAEIIDECRRFVAAGVREITLLGQTVNSYRDPSAALPQPSTGARNPWQKTRGSLAREDETQFPLLLRAIAREVPGLLRLRYTSPHPRHLTLSLIEAHRDLPILARHLHLPVQSGSDAVLRRMLRRYSAEEYVERTTMLRELTPGLTLSTDVIVGFPGETEADFEATLELVRTVGFVSLFGFKYSERPFTPSQKLVDDVTEQEKSQRLARLFEQVDAFKARHLESLVGTETLVLVEGQSERGQWTGRSERNEIVHVEKDGAPELAVGALALVEIQRAFRNSLAGVLRQVRHVAPPKRAASARPRGHDERRSLPVLS